MKSVMLFRVTNNFLLFSRFALSEHLYEITVVQTNDGVANLSTIENGLFEIIESLLKELKQTYAESDFYLRIVHNEIDGNLDGPVFNLGTDSAVSS